MENNSKTLKTIQTLCKVGRILSKITFIICIVGAALCVAGIISLALIPEGIKFDGLTIQGLVQKHAGVSVNTCYAAMAAGIALCAGGAVLAKFEELYFKRELASGTPFTFDGAKELIRLGVLTIAIPAVAALVAAIIFGVMRAVLPDVDEMKYNIRLYLGMGIGYIFAGLLCRYGAELFAKKGKKEKQQEEVL
ncbi:MAG: hypothetical protein J6X52_04445 [Clostridia bacterium]|nr:hypothetical protein [Clostridia bacterium]